MTSKGGNSSVSACMHAYGCVSMCMHVGGRHARALARANEQIRLVGGDDDDAKGAMDLGEGLPHGLLERHPLLGPDIRDQVCDQLRVRVRAHRVAFALQLRAQRRKVLHNAVVDDCERAIGGDVRVGIGVAGRPVRRPPCVRDAQRARRVVRRARAAQAT